MDVFSYVLYLQNLGAADQAISRKHLAFHSGDVTS